MIYKLTAIAVSIRQLSGKENIEIEGDRPGRPGDQGIQNNRIGSIESTIDAIENNLVRTISTGLSVERKKGGKGQACKCMINIFSEEKPKGKDDRKPLLTYAFYAGTYFPSRLGSVAIYADNVTAILAQIRASKTLFGIPVVEATLECGRRPFIDVRFAA